MHVTKPVDINLYRKVGSKNIVKHFLSGGQDAAEVDVGATGRSSENVYAALRIYLEGHPDIKVTVRMSEGKIILVKDGATRSE